MNPDKLLDAIGMVDDRFLADAQSKPAFSLRRRMITLIAAILILTLTFGTVVAVNQEFREHLLSIIHIQTHEKPPTGGKGTGEPTGGQSGLESIDIVDIEGIVKAHYFEAEGFIRPVQGGFFTSSRWAENEVPQDAAFWELRTDGIVNVGATRVDFPFTCGGRTLQITFDYAVLNGMLCAQTWQQGLNEDPYGNGWNVTPIGSRTDVVLMEIPVSRNLDYTRELFLLDLTTLQTRDLLELVDRGNLTIYAAWITEDLRYALLSGFDEVADPDRYAYWLCDLQTGKLTHFDDLVGEISGMPYFLDDSTLICEEALPDDRIDLIRYDLPTGEKTVILENVPNNDHGYSTVFSRGAGGAHGFCYAEDGSVSLIDLRTEKTIPLTGLDLKGALTSESPGGSSILIAYDQPAKDEPTSDCYPRIGLLDPESGTVKMLNREISGSAEYFWGWLDDRTVAFTAHNPAGGHYVYLYEFP